MPSRAKSSRPPDHRSIPTRFTSAVPRIYEDESTEFTVTEQRSIAPRSQRTPKWPGLMTLTGTVAGRVFRLSGDRLVIGRARDAEIQLLDAGVSRRHCVIARDDEGRYRVEDLGSTNGTLVDGEPVKSAELRAGDRIQIGPEVILQFSWFDETEEELANKLVEAARVDALTGVLNRRSYEERLAAELAFAARHRERLAFVAFDIDHFKKVNDTYGHPAGDAVLRAVADVVRKTLRAEDIFARVGGEEFVVITRGLSREAGAVLAERLRVLVEDLVVDVPPEKLRVTISLGVASLDERPNDNAVAVLELLDDRLYEAKERGRNRVVSG